MFCTPDCWFSSIDHSIWSNWLASILFGTVRESFGGMFGAHIVNVKSPFECCHHEFIHLDVSPIKLNGANSVLAGRLPAQAHVSQIKKFQVAVIVSRANCSLCVAVRVPKSHCPAISNIPDVLYLVTRAFVLSLCRDTSNGQILARIPDLHTSISTACDDF